DLRNFDERKAVFDTEFQNPSRRLPDIPQVQQKVLEFMLTAAFFRCIAVRCSRQAGEPVFIEGDQPLRIAPDQHQRLVADDPDEPGGKLATSAKAINVLEYVQESLLYDVFSIFTVLDDAHGHFE